MEEGAELEEDVEDATVWDAAENVEEDEEEDVDSDAFEFSLTMGMR